MRRPQWLRAVIAITAAVQLWLCWSAAQSGAIWAADGEWYWWVGPLGSAGWMFCAYKNARDAIRWRRW